MSNTTPNLFAYRELIAALAWKNIVVRYKQSYLGLLLAVLKPVMLMAIFTLVRSFIGIETDGTPYPIRTTTLDILSGVCFRRRKQRY